MASQNLSLFTPDSRVTMRLIALKRIELVNSCAKSRLTRPDSLREGKASGTMATFRWLLPLPALPFRLSPTFRLLSSSPPPPCSLLTSPGLPNSFPTFQTPRHLLPFRAIHPQQQSGTLLSGSIFEEDDEDEEFEEEDDSDREFEEDGDDGNQKEEEKTITIPSTAPQSVNNFRSRGTPPMLTIKEKKELASYAHSLGKKLKCQQVGKSGVTASVAASFVESLEANELLKLKVHSSCPGELVDVVKQLEVATGSVAVGQIGRTVILYRPSISKLKAAEKKRQDNVGRKRYSSRSGFSRTQEPRVSSQGRRRSKV